MGRDLGLAGLGMVPVAEGPIGLGGLARGNCRALPPDEVTALRAAAGLGPAPHAPATPSSTSPPGDPGRPQASPQRSTRPNP